MLVNLGYSVKEGLESQGSYTKNDDEDKNDEYKNDDKNEKPDDEDSDKYILKSQIVPPVCPKCPDVTVCPNNNNNNNNGFVPQPFANKDYLSGYNVAPGSGSGPLTSEYEPRPMLTDFSQF